MFRIIITIYHQLKTSWRQRRPEMEAANYTVRASQLSRASAQPKWDLAPLRTHKLERTECRRVRIVL